MGESHELRAQRSSLQRTNTANPLGADHRTTVVTSPHSPTETGREWESQEQRKTPLGCKKSAAQDTSEALSPGRLERPCTCSRWGTALTGSQNRAVWCQNPFIRLCRKAVSSASRPPASPAGSRLTASVRGCGW